MAFLLILIIFVVAYQMPLTYGIGLILKLTMPFSNLHKKTL